MQTSWTDTFWAGGERCIQTGKMLHLLAGHSRSSGQQLGKHGYRRLIAWQMAPWHTYSGGIEGWVGLVCRWQAYQKPAPENGVDLCRRFLELVSWVLEIRRIPVVTILMAEFHLNLWYLRQRRLTTYVRYLYNYMYIGHLCHVLCMCVISICGIFGSGDWRPTTLI